jgi:hypothetical protein
MSSWPSTAALALVASIALPLVAVAQPILSSRDAPTGDVWISDGQGPPSAAMARQMQPRDSGMPTGDVWPCSDGSTETARQATPAAQEAARLDRADEPREQE